MKRFRKALLPVLLIGISISTYAQDQVDSLNNISRKTFYINFLGDASILSFNHDQLIAVSSKGAFSLKAGFGFNSTLCLWGTCHTQRFVTFPHHITRIQGSGNKFFEYGLGGTYVHKPEGDRYLLYPIIGYRRKAKTVDGADFRIFLNIPLNRLGEYNEYYLFSPFGVNLGFSY